MSKEGIKKIWGIAKGKELKLTDEELYGVVHAYTGRTSISHLTEMEQKTVIRELLKMKDSVRNSYPEFYDVSNATVRQKKMIRSLANQLGWEKSSQVNGMCKRMFKVSSVEWLNFEQCSKLIEALKAMMERKDNSKCQQN